jgi:hypothetical protein
MNTQAFREALPDLMLSGDGDATFAAMRLITNGMTAPRVAKMLNFACRCMGKGEVYIEIGTYTGFTLIASSYRNNAPALGIDDFSLEDIIRAESLPQGQALIRKELHLNLSSSLFSSSNRCFIEKDFRAVELAEAAKGRISVFFIDGKHTYDDVDAALKWADDFLSPDAIVVFDDVHMDGVCKRMLEAVGSGKFKLLFYCEDKQPESDATLHCGLPLDDKIGNGIAILLRTV